jgi:hypothetical protein
MRIATKGPADHGAQRKRRFDVREVVLAGARNNFVKLLKARALASIAYARCATSMRSYASRVLSSK